MKISKLSVILKKAAFPAVMAIISFVFFIGMYLFMTLRAIEPYYFKGLIFAVPFICFGVITFFTVNERFKKVTSFIVTVIFIIVLFFTMSFAFIFCIFKESSTDISKYERILKITDYPNYSLTKYFPDKIPKNAKNIIFSYNPAFLQGGENFNLRFDTDSNSIKNYINKFSKKSKWIGKSNDKEAEKNGIFTGRFNTCGYIDLPEDFTIYLINSKPYHPDNWNHGELSLAAISKQRNEIIFIAEAW